MKNALGHFLNQLKVTFENGKINFEFNKTEFHFIFFFTAGQCKRN